MCDSWLNSPEQFYLDMGEPPPKHTIERKDNNGPYSPENCVWATQQEQQNNRSSNRQLTFRGITQTMAQWERYLGLPRGILKQRITTYGWPEEKALATPRLRNKK